MLPKYCKSRILTLVLRNFTASQIHPSTEELVAHLPTHFISQGFPQPHGFPPFFVSSPLWSFSCFPSGFTLHCRNETMAGKLLRKQNESMKHPTCNSHKTVENQCKLCASFGPIFQILQILGFICLLF